MTNVIYNIDIPDGPNNPSQDQPKMKTNTNSLKSLIEIDHIGFGNNQGGYHNVIHQPPQISDPGVIAGVGQTYTKTISGDQQLFYESGLGVIYPLSQGTRVTATGTHPITAAFTTVLAFPNSCMGFITFADSNILAPTNSTFFFATFPAGFPVFIAWTNSLVNAGVATPLAVQFQLATYNFQVRRTSGSDFVSSYKYIYWLT